MNVRDIHIADYDYHLPEEKIALHPLEKRDSCKLLVGEKDKLPTDSCFKDIPMLLPAGSVLIYNNTKVINARLRFRKGIERDGAEIEIFCLEPHSPVDYARNFASTSACSWKCLVGNSKRWKPGQPLTEKLHIDGKEIILSVFREENLGGNSIVRFEWDNDSFCFSDIIAAAGTIPIPPYLNRRSEATDKKDYQTVYSRINGSVAAPTAGLHFTEEVLRAIDERNIERREVTLHVGAGTFLPVKSDNIGAHTMHKEFFVVSNALLREIKDWFTLGKKIIAVGTTSVRTLESLYHAGRMMKNDIWRGVVEQWMPYDNDCGPVTASDAIDEILKLVGNDDFCAETGLLIAPGYKFTVVDGMITNFHQPRSTLLLLVSAFLKSKGYERSWREFYEHALDRGYRFLSYGDACLFI